MNTLCRLFHLSLLPREIVTARRVMATVMLPISVFYMSSLNLLAGSLMVAKADTETLVAAKTAAKGELTTARGTYTDANYTSENLAVLNTAKTAGDTAIDAATDLAGVASAKTTAINAMAAVDTIAETLAAAKTAAKADLTTALEAYDDADYTSENLAVLNEAKTDGDSAIDAATDLAGVASAKTAALEAMAAVPVTVSSENSEITIDDADQAVDIEVDADVEEPTIDVSSLIDEGTLSGELPEINISSEAANVEIADGTTVTGSEGWDGVIEAPIVTTVELPAVFGETRTVETAVAVGFTEGSLSFDRAVRIVFPDQAGKRVGFIDSDDVFTEITETCSSQNPTLSAGESCKIDDDGDLVVWTMHFTTFVVFSSVPVAPVATKDDDEDEPEKADVDSWKAYLSTDQSSCPTKLKIEIKGHDFDKKAEVKIGKKEASSVKRVSSRKIVATFCYAKLTDAKEGDSRKVKVENPDTDSDTASKKINVYKVSFKDGSSLQTTPAPAPASAAGSGDVRNIQEALVSEGHLDAQYVTGFYGPITTEAVKSFQRANDLPEVGIVGPQTRQKLSEKLGRSF